MRPHTAALLNDRRNGCEEIPVTPVDTVEDTEAPTIWKLLAWAIVLTGLTAFGGLAAHWLWLVGQWSWNLVG